MARYCPHNIDPVLAAAEHWRDRCLVEDGSVFSTANLWTPEGGAELYTYFTEHEDTGDRHFLEKLKDQLTPAKASTRKLAAELLWAIFLFQSKNSMKPATKRAQILEVWSWSGEALNPGTQWLQEPLEEGVGHPGTAYQTRRWAEFRYLINVLQDLKGRPVEERRTLLGEPWECAQWLDGLAGDSGPQLRHILKFLLFPDHFERSASTRDKRRIVAGFRGIQLKEIRKWDYVHLDRDLYAIRQEQEKALGRSDLDFYQEPLKHVWKETTDTGGVPKLTRDHVLRALGEIDQEGIPKDAQSSTYDLVYRAKRYPPKLVLSLATKYATGAELARGAFKGGENTNAFKVLSELGFAIERKDVVPKLIRQFVAQADSGETLVTRGQGYASKYRDLKVKVSFGQGTFAQVPWISFTGRGQSTQHGIYPCYLYFKDQGVLFLVYGISETKVPARSWPNADALKTVGQVLSEEHGSTPARYASSLVAASYRVAEELHDAELTSDLDRVIAAFEQITADYQAEPPGPGYEGTPETDVAASYPRNLIYYGPPGTGKTYQTIATAVGICDGQVPVERAEVVKRFKELEEKQRIAFVTFHQSYSYEDFVEGIRPVMSGAASQENAVSSGGMSYECRPGVLRTLCALAKGSTEPRVHGAGIDLGTAKVWKMSLGDTNLESEAYVYEQCIEAGEIRLGYGHGLDFTGCDDREAVVARLRDFDPDISPTDYNITSVHHFKNVMSSGDLVIVSDGNTKFRAIGMVTGPYRAEVGDHYGQVRPVQWLAVYAESLPYEKILRKRFSQMTLYQVAKSILREAALQELLAGNSGKEPNNHVLITDEINRGNIAKIFGELITLIEEDKRLGAANELTVVLPYSGDRFGVPQNLYLIGTMNTADRSIALLDTALRRRFEFQELIPQEQLVPGHDGSGSIPDGNGGTIDLRALLRAMNQRIRFLLNRDQMIGHAYFMDIQTFDQLRRVMGQQIIPLLQEYFYEDWHRIQLVLRDLKTDVEKNEPQLIRHEKVNEQDILGYDHDDYEDGLEYQVTPEQEMTPAAIRKVYES